ncbi:LapA family protein [Paucibacter sp. PLA-PC-4]|uniref:LapA family protein n=1 Tax=Paucibacter sp. PLA-PC-4 TaxID=2993655 RepID=UPI0022499891|nr:LapA family protein [Paucibacter sp. PLA-PC-4]MCX2861742.1 LapA family protein [Paucibacter sp. PLA-PC-4]
MMNLRAVAIALVLALLAIFAMLNWVPFTTPTPLTLGFTDVNAPLGLIMLVVTGGLSALFLIYILFQQAGVIMESRRFAKELKAQRELADQAEASRFTELRGFLEAELRRIEAQSSALGRETSARVEQLEQRLLQQLGESTRSLSAYVGEVDDKLDRAFPRTS